MELTWNYLEAGHGKGTADGIGGTVKRTADRLVTLGKDISCFDDLIKVMKENVRSIQVEVVPRDNINEVKKQIDFENVQLFQGAI